MHPHCCRLGRTCGHLLSQISRATPKFGIRLVLGAVPESLALARLAEWEVYGICTHDPCAVGAVTQLIAAVRLLAGLASAIRTMRIEPVSALRYE
jgi:hypothetical protein